MAGEHPAVVPEHWVNTYNQWMKNIQDWMVSRQLWWGHHRIPGLVRRGGWYVYVARSEAEAQSSDPWAPDPDWRDEDVLDTWFSSAGGRSPP